MTSLKLYDDRSLLVLAALALAYMANLFLELVPMPLYRAVPAVFGFIVLAVSGAWFLRPRRERLT